MANRLRVTREAGGPNLPLWTIAYFAVVLVATLAAFAARTSTPGG